MDRNGTSVYLSSVFTAELPLGAKGQRRADVVIKKYDLRDVKSWRNDEVIIIRKLQNAKFPNLILQIFKTSKVKWQVKENPFSSQEFTGTNPSLGSMPKQVCALCKWDNKWSNTALDPATWCSGANQGITRITLCPCLPGMEMRFHGWDKSDAKVVSRSRTESLW